MSFTLSYSQICIYLTKQNVYMIHIYIYIQVYVKWVSDGIWVIILFHHGNI